MTPIIIVVKNLPAAGMAVFPFILLKYESYKNDAELLNHEKIHLRQQLELLVFPFYILYLINYIFNRFKYKGHDEAYREIVFEKEAYDHERDLNYLKNWNWFGWLKKINL